LRNKVLRKERCCIEEECPKSIELIILAFAIEDSSKTDCQVIGAAYSRENESLADGVGPIVRGTRNISGSIAQGGKLRSEKCVESGIPAAGI